MLKNLTLFNAASARMAHASQRHNVVTSNIAHADTPNYVGKDLEAFSLKPSSHGMKATRDTHINMASKQPFEKQSDRAIKQSAFDETLNKNEVSIEEELLKAAEARANFSLSNGVFVKSMSLFMSVIDSRR